MFKENVGTVRNLVIDKTCAIAVSANINELAEETVSWYGEQELLNDSAMTSVKRSIGSGGGFGFGGENPEPIEACALALWGCRNSKSEPGRKMRIG